MNILDVKMININELYPTESLVSIMPESIDKVRELIKSDGTDTEIVAFTFEKHYYILKGHEQLMAAAYLRAKKVRVYLVDYKDIPFFCNEDNIKSTLTSIGMTTIYDFEGICGFTYPDYPEYYKRK